MVINEPLPEAEDDISKLLELSTFEVLSSFCYKKIICGF